ncbi:MAG: polyketide cyclase [Frankiales bacterium]|nr:polyketide cyclase [Frankiales bacterium]
MVSVSRTFTVDKGVDEVVAYLADFANAEQWDPGTESCKQTSVGPVQVGTTWHNVSKIAGITTELDYTLESLQPGKIVLVGKNDTATSTDTITVVAKGAGSEVTYDANVELNGLAKVGAPAVKLVFEHLGNETEDGIKKAVARL